MQTATFAAGCFWGVEAAFRQHKGVAATAVGYLGGAIENPSYEDVCSDTTGHAEAIQLQFDPAEVSYEAMLEVFFHCHDPTTFNRQGPDTGSQYRSAIFFHTTEQQAAAAIAKARLDASGRYSSPVVTEISPATMFYRAEEYHQRYLEKLGQKRCTM